MRKESCIQVSQKETESYNQIQCKYSAYPNQPPTDDYLLDIVDHEWRLDKLPFEQILVPSDELPDPEADNGDPHLTLSEQVRKSNIFVFLFSIIQTSPNQSQSHTYLQEQKWTDLNLSALAPELAITDQINIYGS